MSPGEPCSISVRGTASTRSWPRRPERPASSRSTTTRGASTSWPAAPTGPNASRTGSSPTSRATRPTSGGPTSRDGEASNWPRRRWARKVEPVVADFQTVDLDGLGAIRRRPLPRRAVPHEGAAHLPRAGARRHQGGGGHRDRGVAPPRPRREAFLQFHAGSSLRTDFGNWYVPTIEALHNLCRAAGFSQVRTVNGPPRPSPNRSRPQGPPRT